MPIIQTVDIETKETIYYMANQIVSTSEWWNNQKEEVNKQGEDLFKLYKE